MKCLNGVLIFQAHIDNENIYFRDFVVVVDSSFSKWNNKGYEINGQNQQQQREREIYMV